MFLVQCRLSTAATQFSAATPIVTFIEQLTVAPTPSDWSPRILGYSYNSQGPAHTVSLVMGPAGFANADEGIPLETPAGTVNSFSQLCGAGGIVVPRRIGFESTAQPPGAPFVTNGAPFQLFFSTTNKNGAATFRCWYTVESGV